MIPQAVKLYAVFNFRAHSCFQTSSFGNFISVREVFEAEGAQSVILVGILALASKASRKSGGSLIVTRVTSGVKGRVLFVVSC